MPALKSNRPVRLLWLLIAVSVMGGYCAALQLEYTRGPLLPGRRTISDRFDTGLYHGTGPANTGYPIFSTLSFALPFLVHPELDKKTYALLWAYLMALPLTLALVLISSARARFGISGWPVLLMLSPTILYFSLMRFDILASVVCLLSLWTFQRRHYRTAYFLLAIGVHVKWYPAVLLPVYLAYHMEQEGLFADRLRGFLGSRSLQYFAVFLVTVLGVVGLSILAFGWDGFLVPYQYHMARGGGYFNPYWLALKALTAVGWEESPIRTVLEIGFLLAEFSILGVLLVKRIRSHLEVFQYSLLAIVIFITFAKVDSPQWVVWHVPVALMFVRRTDTLVTLAVLTVLNYLVFPVGFDNLKESLSQRSFDLIFSPLVFVKDLALWSYVWFAVTRGHVSRTCGSDARGFESPQ